MSLADVERPTTGYRPLRATLYFVRHGETDWNAAGRMQGQQDIALNAVGLAQPAESGRRLKEAVPDVASLPYVCSPMLRARRTMELMRESMGLPSDGFRIEDDLREITFGRWEGLTWKEVRRQDPGLARAREADKWGFVPPGGESYAMLTERVARVTATLDRPTVMVAHGGIARALFQMTGMSPAKACIADIWQGRLLVFRDHGYEWI